MMIALFISKMILRILNILGKGGTTLPGKIALKIKPNILKSLSKNVYSICVTGTNGKTTTCALLEQGFIENKVPYFINKSGANMLTGVTTAFIKNANIFGKPKNKYAILECDENSLPYITKYLDTKIIVVTNIFRDQLDRYGEVNITLSKIIKGIKNSPNAVLVLNADCPITYSITNSCSNKCVTFGINESVDSSIASDSPFCPICNNALSYDSIVYGHLGNFYCSCGYKRIKPNVSVSNIDKNSFIMNDEKVTLSLGGIYNIYNYISAVSVLKQLGFSYSTLQNYCGAFGRMETFKYKDKNIMLLLVKNPVGFSNCISYVQNRKCDMVFALNDNDADGRDISWIWDVDFDNLKPVNCYTIGNRAPDMALRLKYSDIQSKVIYGEKYDEMIKIIKNSPNDTVIFSTYTAMMNMRHFLISNFGGEEFWH